MASRTAPRGRLAASPKATARAAAYPRNAWHNLAGVNRVPSRRLRNAVALAKRANMIECHRYFTRAGAAHRVHTT